MGNIQFQLNSVDLWSLKGNLVRKKIHEDQIRQGAGVVFQDHPAVVMVQKLDYINTCVYTTFLVGIKNQRNGPVTLQLGHPCIAP